MAYGPDWRRRTPRFTTLAHALWLRMATGLSATSGSRSNLSAVARSKKRARKSFAERLRDNAAVAVGIAAVGLVLSLVGSGIAIYQVGLARADFREERRVDLSGTAEVFGIALPVDAKFGPGRQVGVRLTAYNQGARPVVISRVELAVKGELVATAAAGERADEEGFIEEAGGPPFRLYSRELDDTRPLPLVLQPRSAVNVILMLSRVGPAYPYSSAEKKAEAKHQRLLDTVYGDRRLDPRWELRLVLKGGAVRKVPTSPAVIGDGGLGPLANINVDHQGRVDGASLWAKGRASKQLAALRIWSLEDRTVDEVVRRPVSGDFWTRFPLDPLPPGWYVWAIEYEGDVIRSGEIKTPCAPNRVACTDYDESGALR